MDDQAGTWLDTELDVCDLADQRLTKRLRKVLTQLGGAMGQSIPHACQDWANTKAAYRFISNDRVSEAEILAGHFRSTGERIGAHDGLILMLHDTTEFSYRRERPEAIGITKSINNRKHAELRADDLLVLGHGALRFLPPVVVVVPLRSATPPCATTPPPACVPPIEAQLSDYV